MSFQANERKKISADSGGIKSLENTRKDPTDASQVPPSVLQKHVGPPTIEHDDATHDRERRHSIHKREAHHGL